MSENLYEDSDIVVTAFSGGGGTALVQITAPLQRVPGGPPYVVLDRVGALALSLTLREWCDRIQR